MLTRWVLAVLLAASLFLGGCLLQLQVMVGRRGVGVAVGGVHGLLKWGFVVNFQRWLAVGAGVVAPTTCSECRQHGQLAVGPL